MIKSSYEVMTVPAIKVHVSDFFLTYYFQDWGKDY